MAEPSRLESFVIMARGTKGAGAARVIVNATAAPGVYTFGELLDVPSIKELANDPAHQKEYRLLELFAYGTLSDYTASPDAFPPLTPAHESKLKHLTLLSLALRRRSLPYDQLSEALHVSSTADLETLAIDTIYAGLLTGKLHHAEQVFHVDAVTGRDLRPDDVVKVKTGLENWCKNAETLLAALDEQIADARHRAAVEADAAASFQHALDAGFEAATKDARRKPGAGGASGNGKGDERAWAPHASPQTPTHPPPRLATPPPREYDEEDELMDSDNDDDPRGVIDQRSVESSDGRVKKRARD